MSFRDKIALALSLADVGDEATALEVLRALLAERDAASSARLGCPVCPRTFRTREALDGHLRLEHEPR